jgi:hypothetical protein
MGNDEQGDDPGNQPIHSLVPCWMPKPLPPKNQWTPWDGSP